MNQETMQLFQTLTELPGAPGFEHEVRRFVREELRKYTGEIIQDRLGSIFGVVRGDENGPKIMAAGHMDEVAFIVSAITENGMLKFQPLGGWANQVLPAQRVQVIGAQGPVPGVIASIPPHLQKDAQKNAPIEIEHMMIDIGADDRNEVISMGIRPGLPIVPVCPFTPLAGGKKIMAKAWDNRYGVGLALELVKEATRGERLPNTLYAGATVQEEVGLRGAETAARLIDPDLFFALDASPAGDVTGDRNAFGQLGKGTLLRVYDRTMVTHKGLVEFILDTASTHRIPFQYFISPGGTDAGKVHLHGIGVPSAVIGIPARYIHSPASIIHTDDYAAAKELLIRLVRTIDAGVYRALIDLDT